MLLVVRPVALAEMEAARDWYEDQRSGLGTEFVAEVRTAFAHIVQAPTAFPQVHHAIRRLLLRRFPYAILYHDALREVVVLAVIHLRRDPQRWRSRG